MNISTKQRLIDLENRLAVAKGKGIQGGGWIWSVELGQSSIYRMDKQHKQQGPTVQHRELLIYSMSCYKS